MKDCFMCYDVASIPVSLYDSDKDLHMCNVCFNKLLVETKEPGPRRKFYIRNVYFISRQLYYSYIIRNNKLNELIYTK